MTVIIDLTPIRNGTGPSRLLDMVEGRSKRCSPPGWPSATQAWRDSVEVVAMDGFTGFKTATSQELPDAVAVMDPFHVVRLAGDALDRVPPPGPAGPARPSRPHERPAVPGAADPAHRPRPAHRQADRTAGGAVRRRGTRRGRGDLGDLPADHRRLPPPRPDPRQPAHASRHRRPQPRRPDRVDRATPARTDPADNGPRTCWPTSTRPAPPTAPPKRSTAGSNTYEAPPSGSAT